MEQQQSERHASTGHRLLARLSMRLFASSERVDGVVYGLEVPSAMLDHPDPGDLMERTARLLDQAAGLPPKD